MDKSYAEQCEEWLKINANISEKQMAELWKLILKLIDSVVDILNKVIEVLADSWDKIIEAICNQRASLHPRCIWKEKLQQKQDMIRLRQYKDSEQGIKRKRLYHRKVIRE
jgi:hypothetical protein